MARLNTVPLGANPPAVILTEIACHRTHVTELPRRLWSICSNALTGESRGRPSVRSRRRGKESGGAGI